MKNESYMRRLVIFNPEHDYALAMGRRRFTPPASVVKLRRSMPRIPLMMANENDAVLFQDEIPPHDLAVLRNDFNCDKRNIFTLTPSSAELAGIIANITSVRPWGWDHSVFQFLLAMGIPRESMPSPEWIDGVRDVSHRRTTIPFNKYLGEPIPMELFSIEEVINHIRSNPPCFLKAPWSSSGRGVLDCRTLPEDRILAWARGILRRQGSIIAEIASEKVIDFATEWMISKENVDFKGLSLFRTDTHGHYLNNRLLQQKEIIALIEKATPLFTPQLIKKQEEALMALVAPYYQGPAGIDMMALSNGGIRSCVEINMRTTMGQFFK
ncbi:MAG: hypothetical protein NC328_03550 [Muribaculum sp.]|nr:hypothetical protein [Muribaculum sp.]